MIGIQDSDRVHRGAPVAGASWSLERIRAHGPGVHTDAAANPVASRELGVNVMGMLMGPAVAANSG